MKKEKVKEKAKTKAEQSGISSKDILVYDYSMHGALCDSVNCVIEKPTQMVK